MPAATYTDAIALLKADHDEIEALFERFDKARAGSRRKLAEQICTTLKIHTMIEEDIFYPALKGRIPEDDYAEMMVEHDSAKILLNDIEASSPEDDDYYAAKVKVMGEECEHHFKEEEEYVDGVFAMARKAGLDLVAMRDAMLVRKDELAAEARDGGLPPAELEAIHSG
ncbi:hemerythrin domain-containing protein [Novosphingobium flavum]|uniref:Hemerythrin domain-containing protein n=1 Tax=Novosphingobium flavum TaxID=1778672 RepID=A0A7X1FTI7_9SPHN|nr:hemerythrin domain-containing protein [Novosphingobium flavum]MBC2666564.1 hemerythrin domain-containing protein [Novosphingobium flavum]